MDQRNLNLTLYRWSMVQYSIHVWQRPELKRHLANKPGCDIEIIDTMPKELHEELDKLVLPDRLKYELKMLIGTMGSRIRDWLKKLTYFSHVTLNTDLISYIDCIHWTHLGCIESTETNKSLYKSGFFPIAYDTWLWLCRNSIEESIVDFWGRISERGREELVGLINVDDEVGNSILCSYWKLRMQNRLDEFDMNLHRLDSSKTLDENIANRISSTCSYSFKSFWYRLNDDQKKSLLNNIAPSFQYYSLSQFITFFSDDDFYTFVFQQYSIYGFEDVLGKLSKSPSLLAKMSIWPYSTDCMTALKESWNQSNNSIPTALRVLHDLMNLEKAYVGDDSKSKKVFTSITDDRRVRKFNRSKRLKLRLR